VIAVVSGGEVVDTVNAVELSVFASSTVDPISRSLMDPSGCMMHGVVVALWRFPGRLAQSAEHGCW